MQNIKRFLNTIFSFGVLCAVIFAFYMMLKYLGMLVIDILEKISGITSNMDSVVIVALITGCVSIVTVIISSVVSRFIEYKQTIKEYLYSKREKPYSEFIAMVYKLQTSQKSGKEYTQKEIIEDLSKFSELLTLWGSSRVIKKWIKFREKLQEDSLDTDNLFLLEDIVFEIRKDMGQRKKGLKRGDLLSFFVNDIKKHIDDKNKIKKT